MPFELFAAEELEKMPTLEQSQTMDLKYRKMIGVSEYEWWLSRMDPEDGEAFRVYVQRKKNGFAAQVAAY